MAGRAFDSESKQIELIQLASCHRLCMPDTASSSAGLDVLGSLYAALLADSASRIIWHPPTRGPRHHGAFAAGTVRYRETEAHMRHSLPLAQFVRLALRTAFLPRHLLARRRWERTIPRAGIGYVLTLGSTRAVVPTSSAPRGHSVLAELEDWFILQRCLESWVDTQLSNQRAHSFYLRHGYTEITRDFGQVLLKKQLVS